MCWVKAKTGYITTLKIKVITKPQRQIDIKGVHIMTYNQFAAGVKAFGLPLALKAAVTYNTPIETTLTWVKRYSKHGYVL